MKWLNRLFAFLGSAALAITLIGVTALVVIVGTFIESKTESHRYASFFTYGSPFFAVLIWLLFLNILISALRRWPFKQKHIPFLMTHLGLLMILSGVIIKNAIGIQGTMSLIEGGTSQHLLLPDTYAVYVQSRSDRSVYTIDDEHVIAQVDRAHPNLQISLAGFYPHSEQQMEGWIKGKKGVIAGLPPFSVTNETFKLCCRAKFEEKEWNIYAMHTLQPDEKAKEAYVNGLNVRITDTKTGNLISLISLQHALEKEQAELIMPFSLIDGFVEPTLIVENKVRIPLSGPNALVNENIAPPYIGKAPITVDLEREPSMVILEDAQKDIFYFAFDENGRIHQEPFRFDNLTSVVSYDDGYGGYAVSANIPSLLSRAFRDQTEIAKIEQLLKDAEDTTLAPPLDMLRQAAKKENADFASIATRFLEAWEKSGSWVLANYPMPALDWKSVDSSHLRGCQWIVKMIPGIENDLKQGADLIQLLDDRKWPLVNHIKENRESQGACKPEEVTPLLTLLSHQIVSVSDQLPPTDVNDQSALFSAYLRLFGIHLSMIRSPEEQKSTDLAVESPLTVRHMRKPLSTKLEDHVPLIVLEFKEGDLIEKMSLAYDRFASGLKWPVLNGKYLVRFQPRWKSIPYKIHLRDARQINYAQSQQPYSYESDLTVTDVRDGSSVEKTISMNNVHQTWDGYRFYLSNISPGEETAPQRVQIIVNYDPTKYWLTYPGAVIVTLGILLLFWMKPYKK